MRRYVAAVALLLCVHPAYGWFDAGHQAIAAAAFSQLTPDARENVGRLLRLAPDYPAWSAGAPEAERTRVAFVRASTWADDIKRRPDFFKNSPAEESSEASSHAGDAIGYADKRVHASWHYIDLPFSRDGAPTRSPETPNALTQIRAFAAALRSNAPDEVKSYDLVWLAHLVGDAHQPLHATSRFSRGLPKGDSGGNQERICLAFTCGLKLHAFWDSLLGASDQMEAALAVAAILPAPDPARAAELDPQVWFEESAALAQAVVYTKTIGDGEGPFALDEAYQAEAREIARDQAAVAAARLARLLNAAFAR